MIRVFQIFIILFWLLTTGLLIKSLYTRGEAGFTEIDSRRVIQSLFDWEDSTRMTLYQDQNALGVVSILVFPKNKEGQPGFSFSSTLRGKVDPSIRGAFVSGLFRYDPDYSLATASLIFKIKSRELDSRFAIDQDDNLIAEVSLAGNTLFKYEGNRNEAPDPSSLGMLAPGLLSNSGLLSGAMGGDDTLNIETKAYRGVHRVLKHRLPVFLLKLSSDSNNQEIKLYFTEAGEPLIMETNFGVYAISEVLEAIKD